MKYNININQLAMSKISQKMDIIDGAILDYIIYLCQSVNDKVDAKRYVDENNVKWTWLDYESLISNMPMLGIKTSGGITHRIKKIEESGFLETKLVQKQTGRIVYIKLTDLIDRLFVSNKDDFGNLRNSIAESENNVILQGNENPQLTDVSSATYDSKFRNLRNSTYNNNIDNNNINNENMLIHNHTSATEGEEPKKPVKVVDTKFDEFWSIYPVHKGKATAMVSWGRVPKKLHDVIIADVKRRIKEDRQWSNVQYIPHASTYLNQKRWEDEIIPDGKFSPKALQETKKYGSVEVHEVD